MKTLKALARIGAGLVIQIHHDPARSYKKMAKYALTSLMVGILLVEVVMAVMVGRTWAATRDIEKGLTIEEMRDTGSNDFEDARWKILSAHTAAQVRAAAADLRKPYTYWRMSDTWVMDSRPREFKITRQLQGAFLRLSVTSTDGLVQVIDQPVLWARSQRRPVQDGVHRDPVPQSS